MSNATKVVVGTLVASLLIGAAMVLNLILV